MISKFKNLLIAIFFFVGLFFIYNKNIELNFVSKLILIFLYVVILISILFYYFKIKSIKNSPIFALTNLYFFICYLSLFFFNKKDIFNNFNNSDFSIALKILLYGYLTYVFGYLFIILVLRKYKRTEIKYFNCNLNEIFILGTLLISGNIIIYYIIKIQEYFSALHQIKYPTLLLGIGLLVLFIFQNKKKNKILNFFCIFLIAIPIFNEIIGGSYAFPFLLIFLIYVFYCQIKKKIIIFPFIIIGLIFLFIHFGKYEYRRVIWNKDNQEMTQFSKIKIFFNIYKNMIPKNVYQFKTQLHCVNFDVLVANTPNVEDNLDCIFLSELNFRRIFHSFQSLLVVSKNTPDIIPYWNGYSYSILASKIIPRIFWKDKPSDTLGNMFGNRYNVMAKYVNIDRSNILRQRIDHTTSWNMPVLNEFYVNFGTMGVIYGMFIIGVLFGLIDKIFFIQKIQNLEMVINFFIFTPIFFLESHLSLIFGSLIQSYIFLIILCFVFLLFIRRFKLL